MAPSLRPRPRRWAAAAGVAAMLVAAPAAHAQTTVVSVASGSGAQGNGASWGAVVSANGRFVAFTSAASNLVPHDGNGVADVFERDLARGETRRVSVTRHGRGGDGPSEVEAISADGRLVVFRSAADDLARRDRNGHVDVFLYDRRSGRVRRLSATPRGREGIVDAGAASMSPDGRVVVFREAYGARCGTYGIFRLDRRKGALRLVSRRSDGSPICVLQTPVGVASQVSGGIVSGDGRVVAFQQRGLMSDGGPIPGIVVRAGASTHGGGAGYPQDLTPDGQDLLYASWDVGGTASDLFLRHRDAGRTDRLTGIPTAPASGRSRPAAIADDGDRVAFASTAPDLVVADTNGVADIFLRDIGSRTTTRISLASTGAQLRRASRRPAISADGRFVAFDSAASAIVAGDRNGHRDVFLTGPLP